MLRITKIWLIFGQKSEALNPCLQQAGEILNNINIQMSKTAKVYLRIWEIEILVIGICFEFRDSDLEFILSQLICNVTSITKL
jgi:hypothetical protein